VEVAQATILDLLRFMAATFAKVADSPIGILINQQCFFAGFYFLQYTVHQPGLFSGFRCVFEMQQHKPVSL
jgi:hypothetical protein